MYPGNNNNRKDNKTATIVVVSIFVKLFSKPFFLQEKNIASHISFVLTRSHFLSILLVKEKQKSESERIRENCLLKLSKIQAFTLKKKYVCTLHVIHRKHLDMPWNSWLAQDKPGYFYMELFCCKKGGCVSTLERCNFYYGQDELYGN